MEPIDFNGLDTTVHGPLRLGVLTALQLDGPHDFTALKKRLGAADGSLGLQLQKLEEAAYVRSERSFVGRRPRTTYLLTGREDRPSPAIWTPFSGSWWRWGVPQERAERTRRQRFLHDAASR